MAQSLVLPELVPEYADTQQFPTAQKAQRGIVAGVVGNILEWYDFALFGFFAPQIGAHFFPATNATASTLAAFGTFAAGFLMRPIGSFIFGRVADRRGRRTARMLSVLMMCGGSLMIAVLPTYATVGALARVLLLTARVLQGLSVGGE